MHFLLGLDPGGVGNFGWCVALNSNSLPSLPFASGLADSASLAIDTALAALPAGGVLDAAGIDAPLFWSRSGSRLADKAVRTAIRSAGAPHAAGTVQDVNSLRGACLVQGMLAGLDLRDRFSALPITEAHPKALRWLLPEVCSITLTSEHERDAMLAVIAAWAVIQQPDGWSDLLSKEVDIYSPIAQPLAYIMPNVPYNNSFKPNRLRPSA